MRGSNAKARLGNSYHENPLNIKYFILSVSDFCSAVEQSMSHEIKKK